LAASVAVKRRPRSICLTPQEQKIGFTFDAERARFIVLRVDGHQMVLVEE